MIPSSPLWDSSRVRSRPESSQQRIGRGEAPRAEIVLDDFRFVNVSDLGNRICVGLDSHNVKFTKPAIVQEETIETSALPCPPFVDEIQRRACSFILHA